MFSRLKSLPLTIVLTILIWMYAEAQFTSTREGVRLSVKINSPSPDRALRLVDGSGVPLGSAANLTITIQGAKNQLDRIYQQSLNQGGGGTADDEEFNTLSYTPAAEVLERPRGDGTIDTVSMLNRLPFFRNRSVIVTDAVPARVRLDVDTVEHLVKPVEFRPSVTLERFALTPEQVTVNIPSRLLQQIGSDRITVTALPQSGGREIAFLPPGTDQTLPVRFNVDYPATRDERVTVTPAQGSVTIRLPQRQGITETIPDLPVWVSGPPEAVARYDVELRPRFLRVVVSGSPAAIQALRQRLSASSPPVASASNIHAYLDITPADRPSATSVIRTIRYTLPEGLSIQEAPTTVDFRLMEKPQAKPTTEPGAPK